jgi:hypothetical protein
MAFGNRAQGRHGKKRDWSNMRVKLDSAMALACLSRVVVPERVTWHDSKQASQ